MQSNDLSLGTTESLKRLHYRALAGMARLGLALSLGLAAASGLAACGDDASETISDPPQDPPPNPPNPPADVDAYGQILMQRDAANQVAIAAQFAADKSVLNDCVQVTEDAASGCTAQVTPAGCDPLPANFVFIDAGDLSATSAANTATIQKDVTTMAYVGTAAQDFVTQGQEISVSATGALPDGVPAFTTTTLPAAGTAPAVDLTAAPASRADGYTLSWDGAGLEDELYLVMSTIGQGGITARVECVVDASQGSVALPASMVDLMVDGSARVRAFHQSSKIEQVGAAPEPVYELSTEVRTLIDEDDVSVQN